MVYTMEKVKNHLKSNTQFKDLTFNFVYGIFYNTKHFYNCHNLKKLHLGQFIVAFPISRDYIFSTKH